ncbi:exocyst complex component SEC3A-like isoform X3 [Vigna unguiculata]|nr:exocyst complex component SEC3A-like isoform X3 [Vigna unguiculata]
MALWAKENTPAVSAQSNEHGGASIASSVNESELKVYVEKELVSQAEEEDIEALLGTYIMGVGEAEAFSERLKRELMALEAANVHAILESEPLIDEVLHGLESATNCLEDMNEWLGMFNVKLRHMREDIESIETRNNKLEMQNVNNKSLIEELDKLLEQLSIPAEYSACLTGDSFDEAEMQQNIEACEWLTTAMRGLEKHIDPTYVKMRGVKEKRGELQIIKSTFVGKASEYMRNYFATFVDFMLNDKNYFSQRGQLKRPDHADLRFKCRTYARLLKHLKILDKNCLGPLRKAYCSSLNLLLRKEAREFANELRAGVKTSKTPSVWLDVFTGSGQNVNAADTATVSDAYAKMLTIFIPLLVDESVFFAHFLCFEVPSTVNGNKTTHNNEDDDGVASGRMAVDLASLNEALQDLLDGLQEDFGSVVDWAYKIDPLCCISMHGTTERYLSGQKGDAAGYVRVLLDDLEARISFQFGRFVDDASHQIERNERNARQTGVLPYIPRSSRSNIWRCRKKLSKILRSFVQLICIWRPNDKVAESRHISFIRGRHGLATKRKTVKQCGKQLNRNQPAKQCQNGRRTKNPKPNQQGESCCKKDLLESSLEVIDNEEYYRRFAALATRMEQFVAGQSRDLVDQAYTKFVSIMFVTLEKNAQADPKYADIFLIENYAAFQNSLYDLANVVPTLAKFYHQASEAYEQACTRHISVIIYYQFERLFQFARKIEDLILNNVAPEEIPFQVGLSKADLRKTLKSSLSGVDKSIAAMYKKLQKNLTSEELLPSLWDKCKKDFLDKYETFVQLVAKIYPAESVPSVAELRDLLASM